MTRSPRARGRRRFRRWRWLQEVVSCVRGYPSCTGAFGPQVRSGHGDGAHTAWHSRPRVAGALRPSRGHRRRRHHRRARSARRGVGRPRPLADCSRALGDDDRHRRVAGNARPRLQPTHVARYRGIGRTESGSRACGHGGNAVGVWPAYSPRRGPRHADEPVRASVRRHRAGVRSPASRPRSGVALQRGRGGAASAVVATTRLARDGAHWGSLLHSTHGRHRPAPVTLASGTPRRRLTRHAAFGRHIRRRVGTCPHRKEPS